MAYRIAMAGARGPFVGPWIRCMGTEYAIESNAAVVLEVEALDNQIKIIDIPAQRQQFPIATRRYRIHIPQQSDSNVTVRVYLE